MSGRFEAQFAELAAPAYAEHFAERDESGELGTIAYHATEDAQPFSWPAIVYRIEFQDDVSPRGELRRIETRRIVLERVDMEAGGVTGFQKKAWVEIGDTHWALRETESRWGDPFVTLSLVRIPLIEMGAQRGSV